MSKIDDLLAQEGAAAENYEMPEDLPAHVRASRPDAGRSTVVSVRLSDEEHARVRRAATEANLPVSTLIRLWTLDRLHAEAQGAGDTVTKRLERLELEVFRGAPSIDAARFRSDVDRILDQDIEPRA